MSGDMVAWLRTELDRREQTARAAGGDAWHLDTTDGRLLDLVNGKPATVGTFPMVVVRGSGGAVAQRMATGRDDEIARGAHIAANDPRAVLRRVAADRKTLDEHADDGYGDCVRCAGEDEEAESSTGAILYLRTQVPHPCATVRNLTEGYGWAREDTTL